MYFFFRLRAKIEKRKEKEKNQKKEEGTLVAIKERVGGNTGECNPSFVFVTHIPRHTIVITDHHITFVSENLKPPETP